MEQCANHTGLESRIDALEKDNDKQWSFIDQLQKALNYRLPLWATFLIAGQSAVIGYLVKGGG